MQQLIAKIGKGHKGAKDLTWEEAKKAMRFLIEGEASPGQVGAFLMAMRIKTESISELAAFTSIARQYVPSIQVPSDMSLVDLPVYGEKYDTYHVLVAAGIVAASAGATVLIHGNENQAVASNVSHVLRSLGIPTAHDLGHLPERLATSGLAYLDLALYHPPLARLLDLRQEFGVQNLAHQVARMLNPARAKSQVIGIAHPPYLDKFIEALHLLNASHVLVLQGVEGFPELSLSTTTSARELRREHVTPLTIRPQDIGMRFGSFQTMSWASLPAGASRPDQEAKLVTQILQNQTRGDHRAWVILNAALLLYASGRASSLSKATPLVEQALGSGMASQKLHDLSVNHPMDYDNSGLSPETVHA